MSVSPPVTRETKHVPAILQRPERVRFLKLIAIFKIFQGVLLLVLGFSLFFFNSRAVWLEPISDWADEELLLHHSRPVIYLLNKFQDALAEGELRVTCLLAFSIPPFSLPKDWRLFAKTLGGISHDFRNRGADSAGSAPHLAPANSSAIIILVVNCFIVWFLYRVLRRDAELIVAPDLRSRKSPRSSGFDAEGPKLIDCFFHRQPNNVRK